MRKFLAALMLCCCFSLNMAQAAKVSENYQMTYLDLLFLGMSLTSDTNVPMVQAHYDVRQPDTLICYLDIGDAVTPVEVENAKLSVNHGFEAIIARYKIEGAKIEYVVAKSSSQRGSAGGGRAVPAEGKIDIQAVLKKVQNENMKNLQKLDDSAIPKVIKPLTPPNNQNQAKPLNPLQNVK